ncbi:unnamed protein product [Rotaria sordida]|uniref:SHSP domain-containing protein n=1 Tax=Rotaria sordida TaxID=392033 RepID=A0A814RZ13_9BILA|nr:unnamed protein product [Rotaria sordida]CAF1139890.1 unnamed protein product [Rotaria sordida]
MATQTVPIHRTNTNSSASNNKTEVWFNAFDFAPGQDENIRWLSRPNQQLVEEKHSYDAEKFRITFDVENFQPDQIKIYIQNHKLTISGVYEERTENRFVQKKFEKNVELPGDADVDSIASFITPAHMLVVEIPLHTSTQADHLNITSNQNNQRRLSFSLDKYSTSNNQGLLSTSNDVSSSSTTDQQIQRTSVTKTTKKTTTTTTTGGLTDLTHDAAELLKNVDTTTASNIHSHSTHTSEHYSSDTGIQKIDVADPDKSSSTTTKQIVSTSSDLANLPIEIPPELLASGGTITIKHQKVTTIKEIQGNIDQGISIPIAHSTDAQSTTTKQTVSTSSDLANLPIQISPELLASGGTITIQHQKVTTIKEFQGNIDQGVSIPITHSTDAQSTKTTSTTTKEVQGNIDQGVSIPITRSTDAQSTSTKTTSTTNNTSQNTLNQQQSSTSERHDSKTTSSSNQNRKYTLEEFLQNKTWNPSLVDGPDGKKILYMRLQMKPGTTLDQMKISLNGYDLRIEVNNKVSTDGIHYMSEHSYRQVTLFPSCEVDHLTTELKDDGFLHIQVPIKL